MTHPRDNEDEPVHRVPAAYFPVCRQCGRRHPFHESCQHVLEESATSATMLAIAILFGIPTLICGIVILAHLLTSIPNPPTP